MNQRVNLSELNSKTIKAKNFFVRYENKIDNKKDSFIILLYCSYDLNDIKKQIIDYKNLDCEEKDIDILVLENVDF